MLKVVDSAGLADNASGRRHRLLEAMALQEIEGNPLDAEQVAMFDMFEHEGWTHEQALAHILKRHQQPA